MQVIAHEASEPVSDDIVEKRLAHADLEKKGEEIAESPKKKKKKEAVSLRKSGARMKLRKKGGKQGGANVGGQGVEAGNAPEPGVDESNRGLADENNVPTIPMPMEERPVVDDPRKLQQGSPSVDNQDNPRLSLRPRLFSFKATKQLWETKVVLNGVGGKKEGNETEEDEDGVPEVPKELGEAETDEELEADTVSDGGSDGDNDGPDDRKSVENDEMQRKKAIEEQISRELDTERQRMMEPEQEQEASNWVAKRDSSRFGSLPTKVDPMSILGSKSEPPRRSSSFKETGTAIGIRRSVADPRRIRNGSDINPVPQSWPDDSHSPSRYVRGLPGSPVIGHASLKIARGAPKTMPGSHSQQQPSTCTKNETGKDAACNDGGQKEM